MPRVILRCVERPVCETVIRIVCAKKEVRLTGNHEAEMRIENGNDGLLHSQHYKFTDAKRELTLFYADNVLMLSGGY